jgi:glutamate formiminotransferase / 5-formyltetrahydrofolate cyclo-ligase
VRLLECVPNISEGRDQAKIAAISEAIVRHEGVRLLDISSDKDHHRSVIRFVGEPQRVRDAALSMALKAIELIDMRGHRGEHPRLGAVDVVPFVPVQGVSMEEAVRVAVEFGQGLGRRGIPVFYYEEAALHPERKDLPAIRRGEYEGLPEKLRNPRWKPDEGPPDFNPLSGATVVGARFPLVAYNVNLRTEDLSVAKEIARKIRFKDGGFPHVRAMGIFLKERRLVQVSMNLTRYQVTQIPVVLEAIREEALEKGVEMEDSEIVGLIPLGALETVVRHYLKAETFSVRQVIEQRILEFE